MPVDPVCGREVDLRTAHAMKITEGRALYFCCARCADGYAMNPGAYPASEGDLRLAVGVMGSSAEEQNREAKDKAHALGEAIARRGFNLITGACPGLPLVAAEGTKAGGGLSIGISPALSLQEHLYKYRSPIKAFDLVVYTGSGLMGREVTNIRSSDMVVILGGRSGTLGEFAIAYDEGKLIGVLDGTGGITEQIDGLVTCFSKATGAIVLHDQDPAALIQKLSETYEKTHFRRPSCFCVESVGAAL